MIDPTFARPIASRLLLILLVSCFTELLSAPVEAAPAATSTLVIQSSGSCIDINGGSNQTGFGVDEWNCTGTYNQQFRFDATADGAYIIRTAGNDLCLDAGTGSLTTGIQIRQNPCSGFVTQKWKLIRNDDGSHTVSTANGAGCIDVYAGRSANGTIVTTYGCHFGTNQRFQIAGLVETATAQPSTALAVPQASTNPSAPKIFNASSSAHAGEIISIQGANFDAAAKVWIAGTAAARQLSIVNRVGTIQLTVQLPASASGGLIAWVTNSFGVSNAVRLNGATPFHLDALEIAPRGAFRLMGKNLVMPGSTPTLLVDGQPASINLGASDQNILTAIAPASLSPGSVAKISIDNGNGTGPAILDRSISVIAGSGDPFALGVGWGAAFKYANRVITVNTPCNGIQDDSANIQNAINAAARSGGVVQLPARECLLANSIVMSSNVVLKGAGKGTTILRYRSDYPVRAQDSDLVGLQDLALVNAGSATEGLLWKNNTHSFLQRVRIDIGNSHQLFLTENRNLVVSDSDFVQKASIGGQNPYLFSNSSGFVFSGNTTTTADGSPTFTSVHDALIINNRFTRDASHQNESEVIANHRLVMDFAYRIAIVNNTLDVANGRITNTARNDGETLLAEGGGNGRTENIGTVVTATATTLSDSVNLINVNPFGTGLPENYGIAIVNGRGAGQTRNVVGYSARTLRVDYAWEVIPDATSRYSTFVWGLDKSLIRNNRLSGNPRGIWLYQTAVRDVEILNNTIVEGGGIFLRSYQSQSAHQFDPIYNVRIDGNSVSNTNGIWMSYFNAIFVNKDASPFGMAMTGIEIRNNTVSANVPNVSSNTEDYASREGFMNLMRSEATGGRLTDTAMVVGTILQNNRCTRCTNAFVLGTGAYGTTVIDNTSSAAPQDFLLDWKTLGSSIAGSIDTIVR